MKRFVLRLFCGLLVLALPIGVFELLGLISGEKESKGDILSALVSVYGTEGDEECYKAFAVILNTLKERGEFSPSKEEGYLWSETGGDAEWIEEVVSSVEGQVLLYENKPILAAFHQSSGGSTLSYKSVFGEEVPYLLPVESDSVTERQTLNKTHLMELYGVSDGFSVVSDGEKVKEIMAGEKIIPADDFRRQCGIYSTVFELREKEEEYEVLSKGVGHQVGFSVTGAEELAGEGKSYEEILKHYYSGVSIGKALK